MADDEDLEARLNAAMGTGDPETRRPVSLTEALYSRIVEVTRQEVSQTTEVLGELVIQMGRLDRRMGDIAARIDSAAEAPAVQGDGPAPATVDLGGIESRLDRLESLLGELPERVAPMVATSEPAPAVDLDAVTKAIDTRLIEIRTAILTGQPDLASVTDAVARGLGDVRTAILTGQPDLSPVTDAVAELRQIVAERPETGPTTEPVDLSPVTAALADLRQITSAPPDLTPVTDVVTQWLADVRTTLSSRLDELQRRLDQPADLTSVSEVIADRLAAMEGATNAHQAVHTSRLDDLATALSQATQGLHTRLDEVTATPTSEVSEVTPAVQALEAALDSLRVELASRDERLGQHLDRVEQAASETPMPPELEALATDLANRLDAVHAAVSDGPDVAAVVRGAVAGGNDNVAAELENIKAAVAATGARFAARLDELRSELAGDADANIARLEAGLSAQTAPPVEIDLAPIQTSLTELRSRLADLSDQAVATEESLATGLANLHASMGQAPDLSAVTTAVEDVAQRVERLATGVAHDNEALAARLDAARTELQASLDGVEIGPPLEAAVAGVLAQLSDLAVAQSQSHQVVTARLDELHQAAGGATDLSPVTEALAEAVASLGGQLDAIALASSQPPDLSVMAERVATGLADTRDQMVSAHEAIRSEVEGLGHALAEVAGQVGAAPSAVEALGARLDSIERLASQVQADARQTSTDIAAGQASTTTAVQAVVDGLTDQLTRVTTALDDIRATPPDTEVVDAKLEQLRVLVSNLGEGVAAIEARSGTEALGALFDEHAADALARLQEVTEGMLTRMERRDSQLSSIRVDIEQALGQTLNHLQGDLTTVREAVTAGEQQGNRRFERLDSELAELRTELAGVGRLQQSLSDVGGGLDALRSLVAEQGEADASGRLMSGLADITRDLAATRERVLEVDRSIAAMKGDLAGSTEAAQASFQAADAVATLVQGVTRLESRLGIEVDDITRRLDAVAAALEAMATRETSTNAASTASRQRMASGMSDRLIAIREVAAGVSEAVRNDARRRRERRAIESGHRPSE
ncbi:MAG: hypothetical protein QOG03_2132 [Actinomycetota bacterium]|jgi:uncharacterized phage infection (PIP) family protein YhgE|nr:hypothetical protein [Actinomycetota bacterium]